jgi:hypothetical protein
MPEIYGPLKTNKQEQRRLFGVALQSKLACARAEAQLARAKAEADAEAKLAQLARAKAEADAEAKLARELARVKAEADAKEELARAVLARAEMSAGDFTRAILARADMSADAQNFLSSLDFAIDDVFDLTPPVTTIRDVFDVDAELFLTPTTSTVTTTTTILTTPQKPVKRRSASPVRAGDKLDFLRYQSPVKKKAVPVGVQSPVNKKAVPVGVVSPSIKDTLRRVYPSTVQQHVRFPVTTPRTTKQPFHEDYVILSDGTKHYKCQEIKDVLRRLHEREAAQRFEVERLYAVEAEQCKKARQAKRDELSAACKAKVKSEFGVLAE